MIEQIYIGVRSNDECPEECCVMMDAICAKDFSGPNQTVHELSFRVSQKWKKLKMNRKMD